MMNRRNFLKIAGLLTSGVALSGCSPKNLPQLRPELGPWPAEMPEAAWRVLNRITFGPRPEERQRVAEIGLAAFIEEQLAPEALGEMDLQPLLTLRRLESLHLDAPDLFDLAEEDVTRELQQATLLRDIYSHRQLYEVMVDFWSNHFNIAQTKGDCAWLKTADDCKVIRPHALGNFHELLSASAHSPAMLIYLDNQENYAGNPNENYARELMELHTMGVDGGYTQKDVRELARCLTGWTVKDHFYRGQFTFDADQHDNGPKQILGLPIPAGIQQGGDVWVIEMLANHPSTARFIATKLVRRFVADDPPQDLVNQAAQTFLTTKGDLKAVLRTVLLSPELLTPTTTLPDVTPPPRLPTPRLKLKRPLEFVASALRQLNAQTDGGPPLLDYLAEMGQPLFQWPTPDGFPDRAEAWNGSLLTRWRFALALMNNELPGTQLDLPTLVKASDAQTPAKRLSQFANLLLGRSLPTTLVEQFLRANYEEKTVLAALLGSPAFQWR